MLQGSPPKLQSSPGKHREIGPVRQIDSLNQTPTGEKSILYSKRKQETEVPVVSGNVDQNLRFAGGLILANAHTPLLQIPAFFRVFALGKPGFPWKIPPLLVEGRHDTLKRGYVHMKNNYKKGTPASSMPKAPRTSSPGAGSDSGGDMGLTFVFCAPLKRRGFQGNQLFWVPHSIFIIIIFFGGVG